MLRSFISVTPLVSYRTTAVAAVRPTDTLQLRLSPLSTIIRRASSTTRGNTTTPLSAALKKPTTQQRGAKLRGDSKFLLAGGPFSICRALATVTNVPHTHSSSSPGVSTGISKNSPEFTINPILNWLEFPNFAAIKPEHVVPAMEALVQYTEKAFEERSRHFTPTWEGTMGKTQDLEDDLERASSVITHLSMVKDSPELRKAVEAIQPMIIKISLQMGQSLEMYDALVKMRENQRIWSALDKEQQRIVDKTIQGMKLSGVAFGLEGEGNAEKKKRFNEIQKRKAQLSLKFSNNVQDATKAYAKIISNKFELEGCPESLIKAMAKNAQSRGYGDGNPETGPWAATLDAPTYVPFMMNCKNRDLREAIYRANIKRASEGEQDNEPIINEILSLRKEEATMLGFPSFGALSLSKKMASNVETATEVLDRLYNATLPAARKEINELTSFARDRLQQPIPLQPWDTAFIGEEYRKEKFKYSADQISEYLVFPHVMGTLFEVVKDNFGIHVSEIDPNEQKRAGLTTWNKDVKIYKVQDDGPSKNVLAYFYGDFYSRSEEKKSGAWMDVCVTRMKDSKTGNVRVPIAYMICNQPPPSSDSEPSRMKFQDVTTLFHEFGHCLQHMLTTVDYPQASGIKGIEWDFVEVASQFMENFAYEPQWLDRMARHYKTGKTMPHDMKQTVMKSRECLAGLAMMRQLHFAMLDMELHTNYKPRGEGSKTEESVFDVDRRMAKKTCLIAPVPEDRFLCAFSHIFGGGYAAGYYSYKYSELYSADAYAALEEQTESIESRKRIGRKYRDTVLAYGGATDPKDVWREFRGRDSVEVDALLRHSGLTSVHA
ncbi:hypothetical protein BX616_008348 [Lobosporangium transversale]|uniref:oligopeptidase A n=1 Tax=Lobosporangium transversale TaxID=64571 RepID=A0A1Y2GR26_9FUNG|nr:hypothetical protein BCR41DRAFT_386753 [Lobosporangium transversale]KAF9918503.1 hypothetical protein BX616_008348 [Lobosporangium transversale]ORZ14908.1 hypothetical protein BCR41DRAFT_386753 [Lobosporangium transversale]|eukprot:XP_021881040.1 hypothetical protein BCR41DRAFT_386753 [Lobosporangium transversale]